MLHDPTCTNCGTDQYLLLDKFKPARIEREVIRTAQGSFPRANVVEAEASFHCMKCGKFNGHTVPQTWQPKRLSPDEKATVLSALGRDQKFSFPAPGHRNEYDDQGRLVAQRLGNF